LGYRKLDLAGRRQLAPARISKGHAARHAAARGETPAMFPAVALNRRNPTARPTRVPASPSRRHRRPLARAPPMCSGHWRRPVKQHRAASPKVVTTWHAASRALTASLRDRSRPHLARPPVHSPLRGPGRDRHPLPPGSTVTRRRLDQWLASSPPVWMPNWWKECRARPAQRAVVSPQQPPRQIACAAVRHGGAVASTERPSPWAGGRRGAAPATGQRQATARTPPPHTGDPTCA
jgi:hypothetical protein